MPTVRNKTDEDLHISNVGTFKAKEPTQVSEDNVELVLRNPNMELVSSVKGVEKESRGKSSKPMRGVESES